MIFKLPDPPAGQAYITKQTANGPTTVLVDKSTLSEDICEATGRTWAEEARLYNIRNAPDGKPIAEPGDQFYQTAESMKQRSKSIGGISAKSLALYNQFSSESPPSLPNLSETMAKIKDGSVNADITASLGKITEATASLPSFLTSSLNAAKASVAAQMADAQAQLPKLQALVATNVDILTKQRVAETGKPPTEAEIKLAQAPLAIFQDGPAALKAQAESITKTIAEAGSSFGAKLPAGLSTAANFAKAGLDKVTDLAKTASNAVAGFASGVPPETIPDPLNPSGPPIPNPAFATFSAIPGNASKLSALTSLGAKLTASAGSLTSAFESIAEKQVSAIDTSTSNLKAFGFAASLAKKTVGLADTVKSFALDPNAFDAGSITQTFGIASKLAPAIDTSLYSKTKDEDLTYSGDDGLVWDRVDAERQRRSLPGLAAIGTPRPPEPPKPDYGTLAKDKSKPGPGIKPQDPDVTKAPPKSAKKTIFEKAADEKISKQFVVIYEKLKDNVDTYGENLKEIINTEKYQKEYFGDVVDYPALVAEVKKISDSKNGSKNKSDYTDAENLKFQQYKFYLTAWKQSKEYGEYLWSIDTFNFCAEQYNLLYDLWQAGKTYGDAPLTIEEPIVKEGLTLGSWEKVFGKDFFKTYADWQKANPSLTPPTA